MADHDQRFKEMLRTFFGDFLRLVLGDEEAAKYDCTQAEWISQEIFPDPPQGERRLVDLVAKIPVSEAADTAQGRQPEPWLVLLHAEIEAADTVEPLRQRIYDYRHDLRRKHGLPVLSMALYLSVGLEGLGWDTYRETYHGHEILLFRYPYMGLPALDAFTYLEGDNLLGVALSALMRTDPNRQGELKAEALERVSTSALPEFQRYLLAECIDAYLPLEEPQLSDFEQRLITPKLGEAMKSGTTLKGQGRAEGRVEGQRGLLTRQLEGKFGPLGADVKARLETLNEDQLTDIGLRIFDATTLRELGLED